jgi:hypothetical protein
MNNVQGAVGTMVKATLKSQVQAVLATVSANHRPLTHLMAYATSSNLKQIYFATAKQTRKAANMSERPSVNVLWDNRTGNVSDHGDGLLVTAAGQATSMVLEGDIEEAKVSLLAKNPNLSTFLAGEGVGYFVVTVENYEVVVGYGQPNKWSPDDEEKLNH